MSEDEARDWLKDTFGAVAFARLERFVALLLAEAVRQSLIARSTFDVVWSRHIADSAQLLPLATNDGLWIDVGSGGGLPGVIVAIARDGPILMVEPRRRRVEFLREVSANLRLVNATVVQSNVQNFSGQAAVISARAVTNLSDLFCWTRHVVSRETQFLLPRGENAVSDLAIAQRSWHGAFHVEQSITDAAAGIVVAQGVHPR